jgi:hypothetical protein
VSALIAGLLVAAFPAHAELIYARLVPGASVEANGASTDVDVSSGGRTVVFSSTAQNWVAGDTFNGDRAVAIDMHTGVVEIVSSTTEGVILRGETPAASADGRYVAFLTFGGTLGPSWQVGRKDRETGVLALVSANTAGEAANAGTDDDTVSISADGRYVAFESSSSNLGFVIGGWTEIFVKDMQTGQVELASVKSDGSPSAGACVLDPHALSDNGRYLTMICGSPLVPGLNNGQVYVRDLQADTIELASRVGAAGPGSTTFAYRSSISPNGRFVTFQNRGFGGLGYANGVDSTGNSGVYLRDRQTQATIAIPRPAVMPADDYDSCATSAVSSVGTVLLECLVDIGLPSSVSQVFLYIPGEASPEILTLGAGSQPGNQPSGYSLAVNGSGLSMAFESSATNIDPDDANGASDIFVLVDSSVLEDRIFADGFEG